MLRKVPLSLETKRFSAPARSTAGAVCPAPTPRPVPPPTALPPRKQSYPLKTQIRSSASKTTTKYSASPPNRCVPSAPAHEAAATRASRQLHRWAKPHPCSGALCLRLHLLTMLFPLGSLQGRLLLLLIGPHRESHLHREALQPCSFTPLSVTLITALNHCPLSFWFRVVCFPSPGRRQGP